MLTLIAPVLTSTTRKTDPAVTRAAGRGTRREDPPWQPAADGIVIVDKPGGMTSHDVVSRMRRFGRTRRVGHAGTLDPMATGVLIVGLNKATRLLTYLVGADKTYEATIRLGQTTTTEDAEGEITATTGCADLDRTALDAAVTQFLGDIKQVPSAVSAIKVDGQRSYDRVRRGEEVELAARPVHISQLDITDVRAAAAADGTAVVDVDATVTCSSGTYVRALARDIGHEMGSGGHLTALRRTRVGTFDLAQAATLEQLAEVTESELQLPVLPLATVASSIFPVLNLTSEDATALGHGQWLPIEADEPLQAGISPDGELVALVEPVTKGTRAFIKPAIVFATAGSA